MIERWKFIQGYDNMYKVSNTGKVINFRSNRIIKQSLTDHGYLRVRLSKNGKSKAYVVHRLVAQAFKRNPKNKPQVNHKNGIKTDNRVGNLEWVTRSENMQHAFKTGLCGRGSKSHKSKLKEEDVIIICALLDSKELDQRDISLMFGVDQITISNINTGSNWNWLTNRKEKHLSSPKLHSRARSVVNCRGEVFTTIKEASIKYRLSIGNITQVCKGLGRRTAGKYEDGEAITWKYLHPRLSEI